MNLAFYEFINVQSSIFNSISTSPDSDNGSAGFENDLMVQKGKTLYSCADHALFAKEIDDFDVVGMVFQEIHAFQ